MAEIPHLSLSYRTVSNQGLQTEISALEAQLQTLQPGSAEYEYDQLQLAREQRELEIRQENPKLDPTTQAGAQALAQIMSQDPTIQAINSEIQALMLANPNACTSWGIPLS